MRRRDFIMLVGGAGAAWPLAVAAQKSSRIGRLDYGSAADDVRIWPAFRERLRELGHVEGANIAFEPRWAEGKIERLPKLAAELVRLKIDMLSVGMSPMRW